MDENLEKSIDALLDDLFQEENLEIEDAEAVEKSKNAIDEIVGEPKQKKKDDILEDVEEEADKAANQAPKGKDDKRPIKEVSDVPKTDKDGSRAKGYDAVQEKATAKDVANDKGTIAKSEEGEKVEVSQEDFEFLQKAKEAKKEEELQKAKQDQEDLIKAMVEEQTSDLKKALQESTDLVKSLSEENKTLKERPQIQKSITSIQEFEAIEKSGGSNNKSFSPKEMLDAAEELAKSGDITIEQVIELENNGTIFDPSARKKVEQKLAQG